jgi:hypothetical protein
MKNLLLASLFLLTVISCKENESQDTNTPPTIPVDAKQNINQIKFCTKDAKACPDGTSVGRNPKNNCEFDPCPTKAVKEKPLKKEPVMCTADVKECSDGSFVGRDHYNNCKFKDCPNGDQTKPKM